MNDIVKITSVKKESADTKTFEFKMDGKATAGQFVMVWIPGVDEIPMSLSSTGETKSITVKAIGEATKALHELKKNDNIGIRGPYGNGFKTKKKDRILVVGGGVGIAALIPLIRETGADTVIGARNKKEVIMEDETKKYSKNVWVSTDDGSYEYHGNAVQLMKEKLAAKKYDMVVACGPEVMLYYAHKECAELGIECQMSLERYMKCGAGLCGSCVIDGMRICEDGPVFDCKQISKLKEFGKIKRDPSGAKVSL
ncbi:MAG: dihydroorotate dehydrogenase electron transfer subunit [Methanomassiliicoccaceae archaeon]|jgi:dihydroorotate dehydrogenase electron transfer subunit|nr:dihydroorotate dehydrogenase electron transfer subunit [Methanomassiliicoccaceae archaeon]